MRGRGVRLTAREVALIRQVAGMALAYPDDELLAQLPLLQTVVAELPPSAREPLDGLLRYLASTPPETLAAEYVATFDLHRRHALHLTWYSHGDTRRRGVALLRLKQTYRRAGFVLSDSGDDAELPDHLCVLLEFAATVDPEAGARLLHEHRACLELLTLALTEAGSPYAAATAAVSATLPPVQASTRDAVARLAAEGPPAEEVGLDPFVPPASAAPIEGVRR